MNTYTEYNEFNFSFIYFFKLDNKCKPCWFIIEDIKWIKSNFPNIIREN